MEIIKSLNFVEKGDILLIEYFDEMRTINTIVFVEKVENNPDETDIWGLLLKHEGDEIILDFYVRSFPTACDKNFLFGKSSIKRFDKKVVDVFSQNFNSNEEIYSLNLISKYDIISLERIDKEISSIIENNCLFFVKTIFIDQGYVYFEGILIDSLGEIKESEIKLPQACDKSGLFYGARVRLQTTSSTLYELMIGALD